jgi:hypothetical protein
VVNDHELGVGDSVLVPWGLDEVEGEVVEVYSTGLGPRATVRLVSDPDGPTVVLPLDSLVPKLSSGRQSHRAPIGGSEYERRIRSALGRVALELNLENPRPHGSDSGADFELTLDGRRLLVQAKHYGENGRVSTDTVLTVTGLASTDTAVLLVANVPLALSARQRLQQLSHGRTRVGFAQWRTSLDDDELHAALIRLLRK